MIFSTQPLASDLARILPCMAMLEEYGELGSFQDSTYDRALARVLIILTLHHLRRLYNSYCFVLPDVYISLFHVAHSLSAVLIIPTGYTYVKITLQHEPRPASFSSLLQRRLGDCEI